MARATRVVCIGNDPHWRASIAAVADEHTRVMDWVEFDSAPIALANNSTLALVRMQSNHAEADRRLGQLCRSFPSGVLVELVKSTDCNDTLFFSHGFRKVSIDRSEWHLANSDKLSTGEIRCYEFRLSDYKPVPDWLNARFWAHPDRFHL